MTEPAPHKYRWLTTIIEGTSAHIEVELAAIEDQGYEIFAILPNLPNSAGHYPYRIIARRPR